MLNCDTRLGCSRPLDSTPPLSSPSVHGVDKRDTISEHYARFFVSQFILRTLPKTLFSSTLMSIMSTLIHLDKVSKSYHDTAVLHEVSLSIRAKQKIGVIGRNGAGKSTLLRLIIGTETPDNGEVIIMKEARLGYLTQHEDFKEDDTILAYLMRKSDKEEWRCAKMASAFDIKGDMLQSPITGLSAGYRMRVRLTGLLLQEPNIILLDEPTNYLDVSTQLLLEAFLRSWRGAFLVVSHDREFLKNTCDETLEVERGKAFLFPGPLEAFFLHKSQTLHMKESYNKKIEREIAHLQEFVDRFRATASKATQAQSKLKQIARLKTIDIDTPLSTVRISLPPLPPQRGTAYRINELAVGYSDKTVARGLTTDIFRGERIVIVGDNGQGKSTLLKTIHGDLKPVSGHVHTSPTLRIGYYDERSASQLNQEEQVGDYLRRVAGPTMTHTDVLAMAGDFLFRDHDLKKRIEVLSGGERARLIIAGLLLGGYQAYVFDEPTNHLDLETVEALGKALSESAYTALIVTHNRTFAHMVSTSVIEVRNGSIKRFSHSYDNYVYHLKERLAIETKEHEAHVLPKETENDTPVLTKTKIHAILKEKKKILRDTEHTLADLEKETHQLHAHFEKNPTHYFPIETKRLHEIESEKKIAEHEWLQTTTHIEKLNNLLKTAP